MRDSLTFEDFLAARRHLRAIDAEAAICESVDAVLLKSLPPARAALVRAIAAGQPASVVEDLARAMDAAIARLDE